MPPHCWYIRVAKQVLHLREGFGAGLGAGVGAGGFFEGAGVGDGFCEGGFVVGAGVGDGFCEGGFVVGAGVGAGAGDDPESSASKHAVYKSESELKAHHHTNVGLLQGSFGTSNS